MTVPSLRLLWYRHAGINVLFILAWYSFSTLISLYNKWMFSPEHYNFPYPLFVTSTHMLVQWLLAALVLRLFPALSTGKRPALRDWSHKVVPCGMATGLDIGLSNLSLRTITLSFYTMCKSSSLAFVLISAFIFKLETPSWRLVAIILIITSGVILMVSSETQYNALGMTQVLTASALGGLRWSLTQILLDKEEMGMGNPFATLFWLAPIMGVTLGSCSLLFEGIGNVLGDEIFFGSFQKSLRTLGAIVFPGLIAFMMNVTEFGLIQRTSVVTLSVAGIFKEVAVILVATVIFHDQLTPINISGLIVTIFGIAMYNYLKYTQFTTGEKGNKAKGDEFEHLENEAEGDEEDEEPMLTSSNRKSGDREEHFQDRTEDEEEDLFAAPLHALGSTDSIDSDSHSTLRKTNQGGRTSSENGRKVATTEWVPLHERRLSHGSTAEEEEEGELISSAAKDL